MLLALPVVSAAAEEPPLSFSLEVDTGFLYAQTDEYVYQPGREHELSRLDLALRPLKLHL
jgi:outer membrane protease